MYLINLALDVVGAVIRPLAARKRLEKATKTFGDDLVDIRIGSQRFIMPTKIHDVLTRTGLLEALHLGAERGDDADHITKEAA